MRKVERVLHEGVGKNEVAAFGVEEEIRSAVDAIMGDTSATTPYELIAGAER